jgi:hypothetical protein
MGMACSMLKAMSMPSWFWGEVVTTVVFFLNRSPTQSVEQKTPYKVWHGVKPSVHYLCTFGCVAHVKQGNKHLGKLDDHNMMMVFVNYKLGSKASRFYDPVRRCVHVSCDTIFEEDHAWELSEEEVRDDEPFGMEYVTVGGTHPMIGDVAWPDPPLVTPAANSLARSSPGTPPVLEAPGVVEHVSPPATTPDIDEEADMSPLRFSSMADLLGVVPQQGAADTRHTEELLVSIGDEPATMEEALEYKLCHIAMMEELESNKENETWSLVDLPRGHKVISLKCVFKLKHDEHGLVVKHKERLVTKGYIQR